MRIENLTLCNEPGRGRASAQIIWEDSLREPLEVYFETTGALANRVSANPHAFLIASTIAAMRHGERRIAIDAEVDAEVRLGLTTAMRLLQFWSGDRRPSVVIEAKAVRRSSDAAVPRAAFCFTGGIDSLASLRMNRLHFDPAHPSYFRDGVLIFGLEVEQLDAFEHVVDVLARLGERAGITMVPVYTNIQYLDKNWSFWTDQFEAAVLASVGHALSTRIGSLAIGSSYDYAHLHPHGSHPLLDLNYSSHTMRVTHDCVALSRLEKTRLLADWDLAVENLRVCNKTDAYRPGVVNCGRCEKCLRTLAALHVVGKTAAATAFAQREVTPELILSNAYIDTTSFPFWSELVAPLRELGRMDLASAIDHALARCRGEVGLTGILKRLDRLHLHGLLRSAKRTLVGSRLPLAGSIDYLVAILNIAIFAGNCLFEVATYAF